MKRLIHTILILCFALSCSKDDNLLKPAVLEEPIAMNVFCQNTPNETLRRVEYGYSNDKLIAETTFSNGEIQNKTTFEYNSDNQLEIEIYETDWGKTEKTFIYNELNQLINIIYKFTDYDSNGQVIKESESEAPLEYENNQLVKKWAYWSGFNTYEYKNGKVVTQYTIK